MGTFAPQSVYSNNPSPQTGAGLAALASNQEAIMELPGAQAPQTIEISDNALTFSTTPVSAYIVVDTEGQAAGDDLEVINPVVSATDNLHNGMIVYLQAADSARVVTVVNSNAANGIKTVSGGNVTLTPKTWLILQLRNGTWHEIASSQPQNIDGVEFNGTAGITHATTCDTAAATAAKTATLDGFALIAGAEVTVKFTNGNTASNPTLNISNTGAAPILYQGVAITDASIGANTVCRLYYDGTAWNIVGIVTASATTSALGTARLATPAEVQAGAAAAGSVLPAVVAVDDIKLAGPLLMCNVREVITTSGTWTALVTGWYKITCIGGGGGGGGSTQLSSTSWPGAGGGGAGYIRKAFQFITASTSVSYTIGAGGTGGTSGTVDGSAGGTTSFGSYLSATGGGGGGASYASGRKGGKGSVTGGTGEGAGSGYGSGGVGGSTGVESDTFKASDGTTSIHVGNAVGGAGGCGLGAGGGGAGGRYSGNGTGGDGAQGAIILEYFNPAVTA